MITFQRDSYRLRIRKTRDTERMVVEIGTMRGMEIVGRLKRDRSADFVKWLTMMIDADTSVVIDDD